MSEERLPLRPARNSPLPPLAEEREGSGKGTETSTGERIERTKRRRAKRVPQLEKTLAILVQGMRGHTVVVEMKNDVEITGVLEETDKDMKLVIDFFLCIRLLLSASLPSDCQTMRKKTWEQGGVKTMEMAFVQGKMVRYVHIPDDVDAIKTLHKHVSTVHHSTVHHS
ncbi:unnamed protein product, partial [Discosporangium mesarthrocarpum]